MKTTFKSSALVILIFFFGIAEGMSQSRIITGTVYDLKGKPVAGVKVSAHPVPRSSYFTSFDGVYELTINSKTKYILFTFPDRKEKLNIEGNTRNVIDFGKKH
ncbi:MAG: hypothetical protein WCL21_04710 [Mariniphaga sp.]